MPLICLLSCSRSSACTANPMFMSFRVKASALFHSSTKPISTMDITLDFKSVPDDPNIPASSGILDIRLASLEAAELFVASDAGGEGNWPLD